MDGRHRPDPRLWAPQAQIPHGRQSSPRRLCSDERDHPRENPRLPPRCLVIGGILGKGRFFVMSESEIMPSALSANESRDERLLRKMQRKGYRHSYVSAHTRQFVAAQIRAMRGDMTQKQFARLLNKPQSV